MNKIKTKVSRETNYIYHMLSVAKCGYDNDYGRKYASYHSSADLKILKDNETHITVAGGEHIGKLYGFFIAAPASLDTEARLFYEAVSHLFKFNNTEDNVKKYMEIYKNFTDNEEWLLKFLQEIYSEHIDCRESIIAICDVMERNYPVYCNDIWEESKQELLPYAKNVEDIFNKNGVSAKLEEITNETLKTDFIATFCNSISNGAEAIDISENQDVFGIGRDYEWAVIFISHEYIIYLLKQALVNTTAFKNIKYWRYAECLAEFYLCLINGKESGMFKKEQEVVDFYKETYENNNALSAQELYNKAMKKFEELTI